VTLHAAAMLLGFVAASPAAVPTPMPAAEPTPAHSQTESDALLESRKAFLAARMAVADGRFQDALGLYRKVLKTTPSDPVVHLEYALLLRDLNVIDQATAEAREAVRLDPDLAEARRLLGGLELAAAEKDPSRLPAAIEQLSAARRLAPTDAGIAVSLARALLAADRAAEAAAVLDELPELQGQPAIQRLSAEAKAKSGQWKEAEALYRGLYEADPGDREIAAALIDLLEDEDKLDDALEVLRKLQSREPDNPAIGERIVLDLARAGRFPEAEKQARELVASRPEQRSGQRLLATVLFEEGNTAEGEQILRHLISLDADDAASRRALASELARERRFDEARSMYEQMVREAGTDPAKAEARVQAETELGFLAYLQKNWAEARRILGPLALADGKVRTRAARILLAADRDGEDFADGLARARAFAAAEPTEPDWVAVTAEFRYRMGETKAAEASLEELGQSADLDRMLAAADAYGRLKLYSAAARIAARAVEKFPESTDALFRLGSSLERAGSPAEAEKVFLRILGVRPNDSATQNYLGYMWADQGVQLERARDLLEKAVAREPRNAAYLDSLGWVYFRLGMMEGAERRLREAYRREPDDPTIEEHMGDLDMKLGNVEAAVGHWEKALELKPEEPERVREKLRRSRTPVSQR
jgi:pentatricopeptide repeat protein